MYLPRKILQFLALCVQRCLARLAKLLGTFRRNAMKHLAKRSRRGFGSLCELRSRSAREIVCYAVEGCHDLVVVGCEGRGLLHGAIGGVSRKVCRRCPVPVLVVRDAIPVASLAVR